MSRYVIDTAALSRNAERVIARAGVPVIGVVKANGYGVGTLEFSRILVDRGISTLAITEIDDISVLREEFGDAIDILVMRSTALPDEAQAIAAAGCIATVGSSAAAHALSEAALKLNVTARCHIKVDTGFGRYGFLPGQESEASACWGLAGLEVCGMYTHFSEAYNTAGATKQQLKAFKRFADAVKAAGNDTGLLHAANSPALYNFPESKLGAVRIGSAFLGRVLAKGTDELERVGIMQARVIDVKELPRGSAIGYGGAVKLERDTKIAFVSAGSIDGFGVQVMRPNGMRQALSALKHARDKSNLWVQIGEEKFAVIGEVDLQRCTVDVADASVEPGMQVDIDINPLMVAAQVKRVYL